MKNKRVFLETKFYDALLQQVQGLEVTTMF